MGRGRGQIAGSASDTKRGTGQASAEPLVPAETVPILSAITIVEKEVLVRIPPQPESCKGYVEMWDRRGVVLHRTPFTLEQGQEQTASLPWTAKIQDKLTKDHNGEPDAIIFVSTDNGQKTRSVVTSLPV